MAWTTPSTVVAGQTLSAAFWNEQVRDNSDYLKAEADTLAAEQSFVFIKSQSFTTAASVVVTDAFSAAYRRYRIVFKNTTQNSANYIQAQMRSGSTTETSANYAFQVINASSTTVGAARFTGQTAWVRFTTAGNNAFTADIIEIDGPFQSARTSFISMSSLTGGAGPEWFTSTGDLATSTSYDQIVFTPAAASITGSVSIYGML